MPGVTPLSLRSKAALLTSSSPLPPRLPPGEWAAVTQACTGRGHPGPCPPGCTMLTGHRDRVGPGAQPSVDWGWPNAGGGGEIPPTGGTRWHEVALPGRVSGSERPWPPPPNRGPVVTAAALPFSPVSFRDEHLLKRKRAFLRAGSCLAGGSQT